MVQADSITPVGINHVVLNVRDIDNLIGFGPRS